jgi:L-ascorbate metabolism protein UlaG (beta-lactamase superfamily)
MLLSKGFCLSLYSLGLLATAAGDTGVSAELTFFGRASVKIRTASGFVLYIDPYAPGDYTEAADLILVTHGHVDHNQVKLVARKAATVIAAPQGAVSEKHYRVVAEGDVFSVGAVTVRAMPAENKNHARAATRGYIVSFDGIVVYHAADTDYLPEMAGWGQYGITYALLPCDGFYNMGPAEASRCAAAMQARRIIPIHSTKTGLSDEQNARMVQGPEVLVIKPGESMALLP